MSAAPSRRPLALRLLPKAAALLAVAALVFVLALSLVQSREEARFTECRYHLKSIELALHNYHDTYGSFPPAITYGPDGKPWHSWRVLMLPFIEGNGPFIYKMSEPWDVPYYPTKKKEESIPYPFVYRMNEPWSGPNNRKLAEKMKSMQVFHCPSDSDAAPGETSYLAVIDDHTLWPEQGTATLKDATDGPETVIEIVEVANSGVHWMEPKDLRLDAISFRLNAPGDAIRSRHAEPGWLQGGPPRANVAFADGTVKPIGPETRPETLKSLLLRDDGEPTQMP